MSLTASTYDEPEVEAYKTLKHAAMHLIAFPRGIRYGAENVEYDLIGAANTPCPFRLPFAMLTDGALARRAITGVYIEFASAAVDCCMQRQHLMYTLWRWWLPRVVCIVSLYYVWQAARIARSSGICNAALGGLAINSGRGEQQTWAKAFIVECTSASSTDGGCGG